MVYPAPSPLFTTALRFPYEAVFKVKVFNGGVDITPAQFSQWGRGLPITDGGSVTVDVTQQVRRTLALTIADPTLNPTTAQALLAPFGVELAVAWGIRYPNGTTDYVPVGVFRVDSTTITQSGQSGATGVAVVGTDRSMYINDGRFFIPTKSVGPTVVAEIAHLVDPVMPVGTPPMVDLTGSTASCPKQVYTDKDRAGAVSRLATSINAEFFIDPNGVPTLRTLKRPADPAAWTIDAGANGVLLDVTPVIDRTDIFNAVVVTGERADGSAGNFAIRQDLDPSSPTYWNGPFGKKPVFFNSAIPTTDIQCQSIAATMLLKYISTGWSITLDSLVNPLLEGGDVLTVLLPDGRIQKHLIDSFVLPLDVATAMSIVTHTNDPGGDQG